MRTRNRITGIFGRILPGSPFLLAGALLLGACSQNEDMPQGNTDAVQFNAGIQATRTTDGGNSWTAGDKVGIYMITAGGTLPEDIVDGADNREYGVTPATGALAPANGTPIYFPHTGDVEFIAYYPYGEVLGDQYKISITGQTSEQVQNGMDLLYAKTSGVSKTKTAVPLTFNHMLSKITLNVVLGDGMTATSGSDITAVTLNSMPGDATLTLQNGTLKATGMRQLFALRTAVSDVGATFTALLIPQLKADGHKGRTAVFTVDGETFTWKIPDEVIFETGNHYSYEVTVIKRTGVTVGPAIIIPWEESGEPTTGDTQPVTVQPESNSYMVAPGSGAILIPVSRANKAAEPTHNLGAESEGLGGVTADNYTVELVWADSPVGAGGVITKMSAEGDYIRVKPGIAGNAVICIKVDDVIKWSWHIWVTEAVTSKTDNVTGLTWMDRNLGAAGTTYDAGGKNGLFYQWGRKDAFPGSDGTNNNQTYYTPSGQTNTLPTGSYTELPGLVQNPLTFATNVDTYRGSLNVGDGNKSWSGNSGEKTIYDPCPPGWKMPPIQVNGKNIWGSSTFDDSNEWTFNSYIGEYKGALFNGVNGTAALNHFYPATGLRTSITGGLSFVGSRGYCYSTTYSCAMYFYSGGVNPSSNASRADGFVARCISE